jgi:hypothetical protein
MAGSHSSHTKSSLHVGQYVPSKNAQTMAFSFIAIGALTFILGFIKDPQRMWQAYLTSYFFFACLAIGGLFFAAVNHVVRSGWSVSVRRMVESFTAFIPFVLLGAMVLLFGIKHLYPWADAQRVAEDAILQSKAAYLNVPFTALRWFIFAGAMFWFAKAIVGNSLEQDKTGNEELTNKNLGLSVKFLVVFALGFTLFSMDLFMTLSPYWYSTIFGIYTFAGMFQSTMAALILIMMFVRKHGLIKGYITDEHQHDVAKFLKGFTVFWAYIAFSQFMLIWYANIPEETEFYILRAHGGWIYVSFGLLIFRFIVPFLSLLPKAAKRSTTHLAVICILILAMQYLDIYWLVYPNFNDNHVVFSLWEVGMFLGFGGLFLLSVQKFLSSNSLVPLKDPRLHECVNHTVTY